MDTVTLTLQHYDCLAQRMTIMIMIMDTAIATRLAALLRYAILQSCAPASTIMTTMITMGTPILITPPLRYPLPDIPTTITKVATYTFRR